MELEKAVIINIIIQKSPSLLRLFIILLDIIFQLLTLLLLLFFLLGAIVAPKTPKFTLVGAAVSGLNATTNTTTSPPSFISTQFTLIIKNPDWVNSIKYENLSAYVAYRNQPVTPVVVLRPPLRQERRSTMELSPVVLGGPSHAYDVAAAEGIAKEGTSKGITVALRVVFFGRMGWTKGIFKSIMRFGVCVQCDIVVHEVPLLGSASPVHSCDFYM